MNKKKFDCVDNLKKVDLNFENKMNYEKFRIESYKNWPIPYINVRDLATNGFFYTKVDDIVQCNFCKIRFMCWEAEDTPEQQHKKWAPYCPLVLGLETQNIKVQTIVC